MRNLLNLLHHCIRGEFGAGRRVWASVERPGGEGVGKASGQQAAHLEVSADGRGQQVGEDEGAQPDVGGDDEALGVHLLRLHPAVDAERREVLARRHHDVRQQHRLAEVEYHEAARAYNTHHTTGIDECSEFIIFYFGAIQF